MDTATNKRGRRFRAVTVTFYAAAASALALALPASAKTWTIAIADMRFQPTSATVARGDTIVWVNHDLVPHTVTSEGSSFDSHTIAPGGNWRYRATAPGRYPYACTFHPTMRATLIVKGKP